MLLSSQNFFTASGNVFRKFHAAVFLFHSNFFFADKVFLWSTAFSLYQFETIEKLKRGTFINGETDPSFRNFFHN